MHSQHVRFFFSILGMSAVMWLITPVMGQAAPKGDPSAPEGQAEPEAPGGGNGAGQADQERPQGNKTGENRRRRGQGGEGRRGGEDAENGRRRDRAGEQSRRGRDGRGGGWGRVGQGVLGGPMGFVTRQLFRPDWMTRDLMLINDTLVLDASQQDVVAMVLEDYDASFSLAVDETQESLRTLGEAFDLEAEYEDEMGDIRDRMSEMREDMSAMRQQMREDAENEAASQTPEEAEVARAKAEEVRAVFREKMRAIRDEYRAVSNAVLASEEANEMLAGQMDILSRFERARTAMREGVEAAITGVLTEEQIAKWPQVDRTARRLRHLQDSRLQGEQIDLIRVSERHLIDLDAETAAQANLVLEGWELDLDDALRRRVESQTGAVMTSLKAMPAQDYDTLMDVMNQQTKLRRAVRDVNDDAIELIALTLPAERGQEFRMEALREGYASVMRPTRAQRAIQDALEIENLDEALKAQIVSLEQACDLETADLNGRVLEVIRTHEEPMEVRYVRRAQDRVAGIERTDEEDPIELAFGDRRELEEEYLDRLRDLLGEELAANIQALQPRRERERWGGGGPGDAQRARFMRQFDADGNGEIDDAEREKIREYFRSRFGGGGRG